MQKIIEWHLPIKTVSEANCSEHWSKKHKRHKIQKMQIFLAFKRDVANFSLPCVVKLTRISPRFLDKKDNLPMSFKSIKDAIASEFFPEKKVVVNSKKRGRYLNLGFCDNDERITWEYAQEKGKPQAVKIEIFSLS